MKQVQQTGLYAGSLTPELEGAACSAAHPRRQGTESGTASTQGKGGKKHE